MKAEKFYYTALIGYIWYKWVEEEQAKCQKYYMPLYGFEEDETYTDSRGLLEVLYQEWLNIKLCCIPGRGGFGTFGGRLDK